MFENILNQLKGLTKGALSDKSESVLGVDIGSSSLKLVQLREEKGVAVLETYGELALGPYADLEIGQATSLAPDKLAEALKDLLREANVTTKKCGVSIPFSSSLISFIEMPKLSEEQLKKMIPIEARKYIPVPISEVQLDWFIIPEGDAQFFSGKQNDEAPSNKTQVLLVAIHKNVLSKYQEVLKLAGLEPTFFEIEIFSSIRSTTERGITPVAILDIGAATTKLYIVEYGIVKDSHMINKGSQNISLALSKSGNMSFRKAEELKRTMGLMGEETGTEGAETKQSSLLTIDYIFSEVRRVILGYQKKHNKNIDRVVLTGGGVGLSGLLPLAQKQFETEVVLADPFEKVEAPAFLENVLESAGPEFTVSVGLALRKLQEEE